MKKASAKGSLTSKAMAAMREAVAKVVEEHRRDGRPLAVWRDGKAVWVSADKPYALWKTPVASKTRGRGKKS